MTSVSLASSERQAIGSGSGPLRYLIAAATVAVYIALGLGLHLNGNEYQVLGIPILLAFQIFVQRLPIRALWVRSAPPLRLDLSFFGVWLLFAIVPGYNVVTAIGRHDFAFAAFAAAAVAGAFGLTYALRAMRGTTLRQLGLCVLVVGALGTLPQVAVLLLPHVAHLHVAGQGSGSLHRATPFAIVETGATTFLLGPVGFLVEEVFFRGALDTYLHRVERGTGWWSAIFVSGLWGLWHLPGQSPHALAGSHILSTILGLLLAQIIIGVPLSLWWRASGNLAVTDTAHAVLDAIRNSLALIG